MPAPFGMPMQGGDSQMLDAPPPNPAQPLAPTAGQQSQGAGGIGQLAGGMAPIPSGLLPPEILAGAMNLGQDISDKLDTLTQVAPDLGPEWVQIKTLLQKVMGQLLVAGGQPPSPTATGTSFPGGGQDRGGMAAA
jgi:hypothetical protein